MVKRSRQGQTSAIVAKTRVGHLFFKTAATFFLSNARTRTVRSAFTTGRYEGWRGAHAALV